MHELIPWMVALIIGAASPKSRYRGGQPGFYNPYLLGGVYSYLTLLIAGALVIFFSSRCTSLSGLPALVGLGSLSALLFFFLLRCVGGFHQHSPSAYQSRESRFVLYGVACWFALQIAVTALIASQVPLFGWDVLQGGEWGISSFADRAKNLILSSTCEVQLYDDDM